MADEHPRWLDALRSGFEITEDGCIKIPQNAHAVFQATLAYAIVATDPETFLHHLEYALENPERNMPRLLLDEQEALERLHGMLHLAIAFWQAKWHEIPPPS